jgi:hypothetical protein
LWARCCGNAAHITNSENSDYAATMGRVLREPTVSLKSMIFMRKLKIVTEFNPIEALGIIPRGDQDEEDLERVLELWGPYLVHPSNHAYELLATKIADKMTQQLAKRDPAKPKKKKG